MADDKKTLKKVMRWFNAAVDNEVFEWRSRCRNWHDYYHGEQLDVDRQPSRATAPFRSEHGDP